MDDRAALYRSILEAPDDDVPRLVFADWLEENGDSDRAHFIRLQCEAARLPTDDPQRLECELAAGQLQRKHHREWIADLPKIRGLKWQHFERGFISEVVVSSGTALHRNLEAIVQAAPICSIRANSINSIGVRALGRLPTFMRLRRFITIRSGAVRLNDEDAATFANLPGLAWLETLALPYQQFTPNGGRALAASPYLTNLKRLHIGYNYNLGDGVVAFFTSPHLPQLTSLDLTLNDVTSEIVSQLRTMNPPPRLRELTLTLRSGSGYHGLLGQLRCLSALRSLTIEGNGLTQADFRAICRSEVYAPLESLVIRYNHHLNADSISDLGESTFASGLRSLFLGIGTANACFERFLRVNEWPNLRELTWVTSSGQPLTSRAITALCESNVLPRLHILRLPYHNFTASAAKRLADAGPLPELRELFVPLAFPIDSQSILKKRFGRRVKF